MKEKQKIKTDPKSVFAEYTKANDYKASVGELGIFEQTKKNERFFIGDQWYGAKLGNERPLVRNNIIKRIGEYKMSSIGAAPVTVNYSAEGIPNTADIKKKGAELQQQMMGEEYAAPKGEPNAIEISVITDALSAYQKICAERVKFDIKNEQLLRNAYISGTGIAYTYWDESIDTGLYADMGRTTKIKGDIAFEILDIENVCFGDPNNDDVQSQPYILLAQRMDVESVRREAKRNGLSVDDIMPDGATQYNSGDRGEKEPDDSQRVTVITKLFKEWDENGDNFKVMAVKITEKAVVKKPWELGLTMYPIAAFQWERRRSSAYGDSEVTYLIPNQIAINQLYVAETWSGLHNGMPKLLVNNDMVDENTRITNEPGGIVRMSVGAEGSMSNAMQYISPPAWGSQYQNAINDLANNTLGNSGANDAALGNIRPDNAAAIIQMREAALQPMQIYQNRYYSFVEDVARIWADFWINKYGNRSLHIETRNGTEFVPFNANRYKNLVLTAKVDVGASTLWSESIVISTLDALLGAQIINPIQYLERLPKGIIPRLSELIDDMRAQNDAAQEQTTSQDEMMRQFAEQYPQEYAAFTKLPPEQQEQMMRQIMGGGQI